MTGEELFNTVLLMEQLTPEGKDRIHRIVPSLRPLVRRLHNLSGQMSVNGQVPPVPPTADVRTQAIKCFDYLLYIDSLTQASTAQLRSMFDGGELEWTLFVNDN